MKVAPKEKVVKLNTLSFEERLCLDVFVYNEKLDIDESESFAAWYTKPGELIADNYIIFYQYKLGEIRWRYAKLD